MNNGSQGPATAGQPSQGQPTGQPGGAQQQQKRLQVPLYKPEQMRSLPDQFTAQEKEKWENGLRQLWNQVEKNAPDTLQHTDAKRKLYEFSKTLTSKLHNFKLQQLHHQAAGGARPNPQGQVPGTQADGSAANANVGGPPQARPQPKISPKLMEHVTNFPYIVPAQLTQGSPEATKWIQDAKTRYLRGLTAMEGATNRINTLDAILQKRKEEGKPLGPEEEKEFKEKKETAQKSYSEAKAFVETFRQQQQRAQAAAATNATSANPNGAAAAAGVSDQQINALQQAGGNENANVAGQNPANMPRPGLSMQQPPPNPAMQNAATINAAIEAARNQQMGGARQATGSVDVPMGNTQFQPNSNNNNSNNVANNGQMPQSQANQNQNVPPNSGIKLEPNAPPQINTAVSQMQQNHRQSIGNNSPQSAPPQSAAPQSAGPQPSGPQGPIRPLTQQAAFQLAARTYSSGPNSGTPNAMSHSHSHPSAPRESPNVATQKMPIPKHLPERATQPLAAVSMSQTRPSLTGGPSNTGNGVMGQPVLAKAPGYNFNIEGDHVLNKKKLDELVRQVTGGGEGFEGGEGLSAEVEEVCFLHPHQNP